VSEDALHFLYRDNLCGVGSKAVPRCVKNHLLAEACKIASNVKLVRLGFAPDPHEVISGTDRGTSAGTDSRDKYVDNDYDNNVDNDAYNGLAIVLVMVIALTMVLVMVMAVAVIMAGAVVMALMVFLMSIDGGVEFPAL